MSSIVVKNLNNADEVRTPDKTKAEVVELGNVTAMKITLEPGWRWSECIKPVVGRILSKKAGWDVGIG